MNNERYPQNLTVSLRDFEASGWKEVIARSSFQGYLKMKRAISEAACIAIKEEKVKIGKALWLLAEACSMAPSLSIQKNPSKTSADTHDCKQAIKYEFLKANSTFFIEFAGSIEPNWMSACICDLLWANKLTKDITLAEKAIFAYSEIPLKLETWVQGGNDCWQRAISLAKKFKGKVNTERLRYMEEVIISRLNAITLSDGFFGIGLANLLKSNDLGKEGQELEIGSKLESLAREFEGEGLLQQAQSYFSTAAEWYFYTKNKPKEVEMRFSVAEILVKKAIYKSTLDNPNLLKL